MNIKPKNLFAVAYLNWDEGLSWNVKIAKDVLELLKGSFLQVM